LGYGYNSTSYYYVYLYLTFTDCNNEGNVEAGGSYAGGIAGRTGYISVNQNVRVNSDFSGCTNSGTVTAASYAGGIAGFVQSSLSTIYSSIIDCENTGAIHSDSSFAGGIVGCGQTYVVYSNLKNSGDISGGTGGAGGIVSSAGNYSSFSNLENSGKVTGDGGVAGGILAYGYYAKKAENLHNTGDVSGTSNVGGVAGYFGVSSSATIQLCSNTGTVTLRDAATSAATAGGLFGYLYSNTADIINCYNTGDVTAEGEAGYIGGIAGYRNNSSSTVRSSYNTGNVTANGSSTYAGGIVGHDSTFYPITNTYNIGVVSGVAEGRLGAITGDSGNTGVSDSYYLAGCVVVDSEAVNPADGAYATEKSAAAFKSGEVSYILDGAETASRKYVWSQAEYPVFADADNLPVYKAAVSITGSGSVSYSPSSSNEFWYINVGASASVTITPENGYVLGLISVKDGAGKTLASASEATLGSDKIFTFTMPAYSINIIAEFIPAVTESHTVTFISEGETHVSVVVAPGDQATPPTDPEKAWSGDDEYVFVGWYTDAALTKLYDFNSIVTEDFTLYAKFKVAGLVTISFDLNYEDATGAPEDQEVKQGHLIEEPPEPARASDYAGETAVVSYTFLGWYTASGDNGVKWDFAIDVVPSDVDEEMTLYVHWEAVGLLEGTNVEIASLEVLEVLAENVRNGNDYSGSSFILMADIELTDSWVGIGTADHPFNGTFNGNWKTITITAVKAACSIFYTIGEAGKVSNLTVSGTLNGYTGGIANTNYGIIQDCEVDLTAEQLVGNSTDYSTPHVGGVALLNYGTIEGCEAKVDFTIYMAGVGGIAAFNYGTISGCNLLPGSQITAWWYYGGICARNYGDISGCTVGKTPGDCTLNGIVLAGQGNTGCGGIAGTHMAGIIENCTNYADLVGYSPAVAANDSTFFGGIAGAAFSGVKITDCVNYGSISDVLMGSGGIVGVSAIEVSYCKNYGDVNGAISSKDDNIVAGKLGGIVGHLNGTSNNLSDCENYGDITGRRDVGGIVGYSTTKGTISFCENTGDVYAPGNQVGGIAGTIEGTLIDKCWSSGNISGMLYIGGIVGSSSSGTGKVSNCYSTGGVSGNLYTGGIVGLNNSGTNSLRNCFYYYEGSSTSRTVSVRANTPISGGAGTVAESWSKCYYLAGTNSSSSLTGIGVSAGAFTSGELAWLLDIYEETPTVHNDIWTQGENNPILGTPTYYQIAASFEVSGIESGKTAADYGSVTIAKGDGKYQTEDLYGSEDDSIRYLVTIDQGTETYEEDGYTVTVGYKLESITLWYADGASVELTSLESSFNPDGDAELVVSIVRYEDREEIIIIVEEEEEVVPANPGDGEGEGVGNEAGDGDGEGVGNEAGDGSGAPEDGGGTGGGEIGGGTGSGDDGNGSGDGSESSTGVGSGPATAQGTEASNSDTGDGTVPDTDVSSSDLTMSVSNEADTIPLVVIQDDIVPEAVADAPADSEPEGAEGAPSEEGGSEAEEPLPEPEPPVEKNPDSIYEVIQQATEILNNPVVVILLVICIGALLFVSIFFSYKRRKRA